MKAAHALRIAFWHFALYCFVVGYVLAGAYVFHKLEGDIETQRHAQHRESIRVFKRALLGQLTNSTVSADAEATLRLFMRNVSRLHISVENYILYESTEGGAPKRWTFTSSVLFSYTLVSTIGYGNVYPTTQASRLFTMLYGAFGIPLFLITIADVGRFLKTFIMCIVQLIYRKEIKKQGERHLLREIGEVLLVAMIFLAFIACGSAILPLWEEHMSYFDSVYFSYMSLSTIGLGDIVPRRMEFLLPTLMYLTIGLWLTTALVEQLADVFRLVHYAGREISHVKGISIWLGGRRLPIGALIQTICRRVGMSDNIIEQINWTSTINRALDGHPPPAVPIFPWHLADFVERDPPLIDLSVASDLEEVDDYFAALHAPASRMPSSRSRLSRRKLSAPLLDISMPISYRRNNLAL